MSSISVIAEQENEQVAPNQRSNAVWLFATFVGGAFILNSYLSYYTYESALPKDEKIISSLCALIGAILLSAPLVVRSLKNILQNRLHMAELASLAVLACFAVGKYQEAGLVAFFLMMAELLESRTALGARAAVEGLIRLTPKEAHRLSEDGSESDVSVDKLAPKDRVRIRPGENMPIDGVIRSGESAINEANVTGESLPADKRSGDIVYAGTINLTGVIEVEVTRVGADTTLGKVHDLILQAEATRLPLMRLIDRNVQWYTPTILMIAAAILFFTKSVDNAITAIVVACPCALVLATPTAMVAGLTCAARLGILIKNVSHLELAGTINAILFDKTGTLTTGELTVSRLAPIEDVSAEDLLRTAASADRHSNHPAARALLRVAKDASVQLAEPKDMTEFSGKGVRGTLDGEVIRVGRRTWLEAEGIDLAGVPEQKLGVEEGYSTIYVARGSSCIGWIGLMDRTRPEARMATESLLDCGVRNLTMVTGDRWGVARRVASELGCTDVQAECLPEQKLHIVESLQKKGLRVAVIGDGVNDAPALAAGDLGIAMGAAGNDIAIHSASIALMSNDLGRLPFLIRLSRHVRRIVIQNLLFGGFLVAAGLVAAGMGWLSPVVAAIIHNLGSFLVIFNSARIVRFGEEIQPHAPLDSTGGISA